MGAQKERKGRTTSSLSSRTQSRPCALRSPHRGEQQGLCVRREGPRETEQVSQPAFMLQHVL